MRYFAAKRKQVAIHLCFFAVSLTFCRPKPTDYLYLRTSQVVFNADFSQAVDKFWTGNDGHQQAYVQDGDYFFRSLKDDGRYNAPAFSLTAGADFEIEAPVAGPSDKPDKAFGIVLGDFTGESLFLFFETDRNGKFYIVQNYLLTEGQIPDASAVAYKKMTIRKVGMKAYFFINERYLYSYDLPPIKKFRAGVIAGASRMVWVDYFKILEYR